VFIAVNIVFGFRYFFNFKWVWRYCL